MKTILRLLSLLAIASCPGLVFAELAGVRLPASIDAVSLLGVFVTSTLLLITLLDYARQRRPLESSSDRPLRPALTIPSRSVRSADRLAA
jgi:hypothetical protein